MSPRPVGSSQRGTSLVEVLVTLVIVAIALLGLLGLQARLQVAEMEAYQRTQALVLLDDMASRITTNRGFAADYVTPNPLGAGAACPLVGGSPTRQEIDTAEWCNALQGAAETSGASKMGAMLGGRGCIESLPDNQYLVTIAWEGLTPIAAPPSGLGCAKNLYDGNAGSACAADRCRRTVTTIVRIATLN